MAKTEVVKEIRKEELLPSVKEFKDNGYRIVQIMCRKIDTDHMVMDYSFAKEYAFSDLRLPVARNEEIPSITGVYLGAFLYENEIHDLFGVKITGNAVDFKGHMYKVAVPFPFNPAQPPAAPAEPK